LSAELGGLDPGANGDYGGDELGMATTEDRGALGQLGIQDPTKSFDYQDGDGVGFVDTSIMTQAQKAHIYQKQQSPRNKDSKFVRSLAAEPSSGRS